MTARDYFDRRKVVDGEPVEPAEQPEPPFVPQLGPCSPYPNDTMVEGVARWLTPRELSEMTLEQYRAQFGGLPVARHAGVTP